jgi:hypothetical protein
MCAALACGSTSVSEVSGPTDIRCATSITANPQALGPEGGTVSIAVSTTRDCSWSSSSDAAWLRLSTTSGQGEATFTANVEANPQITARSGNISVNGQRTTVTQSGRPCTFDLASSAAQFDAAGGSGTITVNTITGCSWRATSNVSWIQVSGNAITGSGGIAFQVAPNGGGDRTGIVTIADKQFVVTQSAAQPGPGPAPGPLPADCTPTVTPLEFDTAAVATTLTIQVAIAPTCAWSATSSATWLTITSAAAGTGSAALSVAVAANTGPARTATVTAAGQTITVRQAAIACTFTLNPTSQSFPAAGGTGGRFTVNAPAGCSWSAAKSVAWIDVVAGSGTGTGDVTFSVQANTTTAARSGTITVGGQVFSVTQAAAPCTYSLNPTSFNVGVEGGHSRFTVTTAPSCAWTAVAGANWVDVANQSGTGTGDVNFNVASYTGATARSTTITVNGQTFTVTQAGVGCTFAINPSTASVAAAASTGQFSVTTQSGCSWTATTGATWLAVTAPPNGAGNGTGDVSYSVQANPDQSARTGTISVGNQTFTVTQAAAAAPPPPPPCTYTLNPTSASVAAAGGGGTFTVTTQTSCTWTASTADAWITVTNSGSTTGSGDVSYTVQPNATGASRSGSITVSGQTFVVTQAP